MKLKNFLNLLGLKSKPKHYGYAVDSFSLPGGSVIQYAQWSHPKCKRVIIQPEHIAMYKKIIQEGDFCIDIGAHAGDTTLPIALAAGKTGYVLALEPNPFVYHVLEKNIRSNRRLCNIGSIMAAAFKQEGFARFEYSDAGFCNGGRHEGIPALRHGHGYGLNVYGVNLQNELQSNYADWLPKLTFIKIDSEGYDLYILETLRNIIEAYKPVIKSEVFKHTDARYRLNLLTFFHEMNYSVYKVQAEPIAYGGPELTEESLLSEKHYDIIAVYNA